MVTHRIGYVVVIGLITNVLIATPAIATDRAEQRARELWAPFDTAVHQQYLDLLRRLPSEHGGPVRYVGPASDPACDYHDLQTAIDQAPPDTELRLSNQAAYPGGIVIARSITVLGGYASCSAASAGSVRSVLSGAGQPGPVLHIAGFQSGTPRLISLVGLRIHGGNGTSTGTGGGIQLDGNSWLRLAGSQVDSNQAEYGGGINVAGGSWPVLLLEDDSRVGAPSFGNQALRGSGGGIFCSGTALILADDALIGHNQADFTGGGIAVRSGCHYFQFGGAYFFGPLIRGLGHNGALFGGGVMVEEGGKAVLYGSDGPLGLGDAAAATIIARNDAFNGGGAAVSDPDSELILVDAVVEDNSMFDGWALATGGGLRAITGGRLLVGRSGRGHCAQDSFQLAPCPRIRRNQSTYGGGISVASGTDVELAGVLMHDNRAGFGAAIHVLSDFGPPLRVVSSQISGHGGTGPLIRIFSGHLHMQWSTIAGNPGDAPLLSFSGETALVELDGSLVWQPDRPLHHGFVAHLHAIDTDCAILHETTHVNAGAAVRTDDPLLLPASELGMLRPDAGSPAIDLCPVPAQPPGPDMDGRMRGQQDSLRACTPYDAGAFERASDRIYGHDFEPQPVC